MVSNGGHNSFNASTNPRIPISSLEVGNHLLVKNLPSLSVIEHRFSSLANLNAHLALLQRQNQNHPVIVTFLAHLPLLSQANPIGLNRSEEHTSELQSQSNLI